jgi:hypothetical protein
MSLSIYHLSIYLVLVFVHKLVCLSKARLFIQSVHLCVSLRSVPCLSVCASLICLSHLFIFPSVVCLSVCHIAAVFSPPRRACVQHTQRNKPTRLSVYNLVKSSIF